MPTTGKVPRRETCTRVASRYAIHQIDTITTITEFSLPRAIVEHGSSAFVGKESRIDPLFVADKINRTIPRARLSLLESMGEGYLTVEHETMAPAHPFFVVATRSPVARPTA